MATTKQTKEKEMNLNELHIKLSERFPAGDVKQRDGGFGKKLDYIPINKVIDRVNEVFPLGYDWTIKHPIFEDKTVTIVGTLTVKLSDGSFVMRDGIGADKIDRDMDKSVKTASAEAFKKACHTLGIGLYLWDEDERAQLQKERNRSMSAPQGFTKKHFEDMKSIRASLKLDTDAKLNKLIAKYPISDVNTKTDLKANNIDAFIIWAKTQETVEV